MKNKYYASLLIGVGLAIASTSGYGKANHSTPKRHAFIAAKQSKKQAMGIHQHGKSISRKQLIASIKHASKQHPHKGHASFSTKRHRKSEALEKILPPLTDLSLDIDESQEIPADKPVAPTITISSHRIHSLISSNSRDTPSGQAGNNESARHYTAAHGIIETSLAAAGEKIGLTDDLIIQLTNIFAWDIDFATNLRRGDQFTVVYENTLESGQRIAAAEFVNQGRILTAVRYQDDDGNSNYYTPEGKAMRKAFLSTPVDFARISSHFDTNRKHPILNRIRAHKGVDYAARIGTPVKSAGDGEIVFQGRKGGYGQVLIIKHGDRYETLYAHLSRFRNDLHEGDSVQQGEIIGFVGQSGLATGPHLHYEFRIDGVHQNPETQDSRQALTLNNEYLDDFKNHAQPILSELYHAKAKTLLARNNYRIN